MKFFSFFVFIFAFKNCYSLEMYDKCELKNGGPGQCHLYSSCKTDWKKDKARVCSYNAEQAIVCCSHEFITEPENERPSAKYCMAQTKTSEQIVSSLSSAKSSKPAKNKPQKCSTELVKLGEFPYIAVLGWEDEIGNFNFRCAASLISDWYVLSAAHCIAGKDGFEPNVVRLREQTIKKNTENTLIDYNIEEIIKHPEYKASRGYYNDIMLIKLSTKVIFTEFIRPACLWPVHDFNHSKVISTGFGAAEPLGGRSEELCKVSLSIFDNDVCYESYKGNKRVKQGISDSMICAGVSEGGKDINHDDSEGPLQVTNDENQCIYHIIGVFSVGENSPVIYTRVHPYLNWIESIIWNNK